LQHDDSPLVLINASDSGNGVRFFFVQEYFILLRSNISDCPRPLAPAVTASSVVPVLFNPVRVENYRNCRNKQPAWLISAGRTLLRNDPEFNRSWPV
jgi:NTE family protein